MERNYQGPRCFLPGMSGCCPIPLGGNFHAVHYRTGPEGQNEASLYRLCLEPAPALLLRQDKKRIHNALVRLHATKDYYRMAALLEDYPRIRQTFNLTPSLLTQLEDYLQGAEDYYLRAAKPVKDLTEGEKHFLLQHYFDIHWERVIALWPRYRQLLDKQVRRREPETAAEALALFTGQDYLDLQVWFNLTWIDPQVRADDEELSCLQSKGENFTEEDKRLVLAKQREIMAKVIPVHRELAARGQIEIITTPFYHPIMPLIIDSRSTLRASPGLALPQLFLPGRCGKQVVMAAAQYRRYFGHNPGASGRLNSRQP